MGSTADQEILTGPAAERGGGQGGTRLEPKLSGRNETRCRGAASELPHTGEDNARGERKARVRPICRRGARAHD